MKFIDITGQKFNRLTVISRGEKKGTQILWQCLCDCGVATTVMGPHLKSGHTKSCGCFSRESTQARSVTHGATVGGKCSPEWKTWKGLVERCSASYKTHPRARGYADAAIYLDPRWSEFTNFLADMGPRPTLQHSIDRLDNSLGYSPTNCRWATKKEQAVNRHNVHEVMYEGSMQKLCTLAERFGIAAPDVRRRVLDYGWDVHRALTEPAKPGRHKTLTT